MLLRVAMLVVLWLLAWGEATFANVASGVAVATALLVAFPPGPRSGARFGFRPAGIARLATYVARQLVTSNIVIARTILRREPGLRPGVLRYELRHPSDEVVTIMTSVIALSPGTMTVDVSRDPVAICVHFLLLHDVDAAGAAIAHLEDLAVGAIGARETASGAVRAGSREPR